MPWRATLQFVLVLLLVQAQALRDRELEFRTKAVQGKAAQQEPVPLRLLRNLQDAFSTGTHAFGHGDTATSPDQVRLTYGLCLIVGFVAPALSFRKTQAEQAASEAERDDDDSRSRRIADGTAAVAGAEAHLAAAGAQGLLVPWQQERLAYLDLWRVICITAVVVCHACESYHQYNIMASQQWVLQILVLVSGACFARRRGSLADYCARLLFLFSLGSSLTWLVLVFRGQCWWDRPFLSVSFQMCFVFIPIAGAIIVQPLRAQALAEGAEARPAELRSVSFYLGICACALAAWGLLLLAAPPGTAQTQIPRLVLESGVSLLAPAAVAWLLPERRRGLAAWAMLACIYIGRLAWAEPRPGSEIHLFDLFIWAAFEQLCPLMGHGAVGLALAQWWPVWAFGCGLLLTPGTSVILAQHPPDSFLPRAKFYFVEAVLVVAFTTIPRAGRSHTLPVPESLRKFLPWLTRWGLFAFCAHRALLILLPTPWAFLAIFGPALLVLLAPSPMQRVPSARCLHT